MQSLESFSRGPRAPPCTQTPSNYGHKGPMIAPKLPSTRCSNQHQLPLLSIGSGGSSSRKDILCAASTVSGASTSGRKVPPNFSITSKDGRWRIRLIDPTDTKEVQTVVKLQADGFHQPNPIPLLDTTFKRFFTAEVLAEMVKKLKYNPVDRFVCLVAEDMNKAARSPNKDKENAKSAVVGIVEITFIDEKEVLASLPPGTPGVAYIQSMAVDSSCRRGGVASAMLVAAERVGREWGEGLAVLHVYQDNVAAVKLYEKQGFEVIFQDAPWLAKLAMRPRYLMRKSIL